MMDQYGLKPPEILMYDQLDRLIECIFLYEGIKVGHWCAIIKHPNSWEIFDPIGLVPDEPLSNPKIKRVPKKLEKFCRDSNMVVEYNDFGLQRGGSTCGLWCILRFLHKDLSCDEFREEFRDMTDLQVCRFFERPDLIK